MVAAPQTPWSKQDGWLTCLAKAAEQAPAAGKSPIRRMLLPPADDHRQHKASTELRLPRPSAPGTPSSAAAAPLSHASHRAALQSSDSLSLPGADDGPLHGANLPHGVAAFGPGDREALARASEGGQTDVVDGAGAMEAEGADAACSVEVSLSQRGIGVGDIRAVPDGSITHSAGDAPAAAGERLEKKRRKRIAHTTESPPLSPPGAFGRAVFGRKKRVCNPSSLPQLCRDCKRRL